MSNTKIVTVVPAAAPTRRRVGRPSVQDATSLERRTLEAALAEFRHHGMSDASVERIAKKAGVSKSALYRRYGSKRALFLKVASKQTAILQQTAEAITVRPFSALHQLREIALAYVHFVLTPVLLDLQRIFVSEVSALSARDAMFDPALPIELSEQLDHQIILAQAAGELKPGPPAIWREALVRLIIEGPRWRTLVSGRSWTRPEINADFDRMWRLFETLAGQSSNVETDQDVRVVRSTSRARKPIRARATNAESSIKERNAVDS